MAPPFSSNKEWVSAGYATLVFLKLLAVKHTANVKQHILSCMCDKLMSDDGAILTSYGEMVA